MASPPVVATECALDDLREQVHRESGAFYAVLDACDEPRVPEKVNELGPSRAVSLYRGSAEQDCWAIAPYLVQVDESLLEWLIENLWSAAWGIFLVAATEMPDVRKHLRRFLMVLDPSGKPVYFRFYDPRVLPTFLTSCTDAEVQDFFGPIERFYVNAEKDKLAALEISEQKPGRSDLRW